MKVFGDDRDRVLSEDATSLTMSSHEGRGSRRMIQDTTTAGVMERVKQ